MTVSSPNFKDGEAIPSEHTCDGANKAPELSWSNVPPDAKSIAILVNDPGAGKASYTHLLITGISPTETSLAAGGSLPSGAIAAKNDKGTTGYTGPCPTNAAMHHYYFRVYALDMMVKNPTTAAAFLREIKGHVVAQGQLVGTYEKSRTGSAGSNDMGPGSAGSRQMGSGSSGSSEMGSSGSGSSGEMGSSSSKMGSSSSKMGSGSAGSSEGSGSSGYNR